VRQLAVGLFVVAVLASGCAKKASEATSSPTASAATESAMPSATAGAMPAAITAPFTNKGTHDVSGASSFAINADNDNGAYYFEPSILKGKPGEKLKLTITNVGSVHHNFTLGAQHINNDMNTKGSTTTVTVTFPQTGSVEFHCEYHGSLGMKGALTVS